MWILPYSRVKLSLLQLTREEEENIYRQQKGYSFSPLSRDLVYSATSAIEASPSRLKEMALYRQDLEGKLLFF